MNLFNGKIYIGVLGNEFYFTPSLYIVTDSHTLIFNFLICHITIQLKQLPPEQSNGLSPEAQAKLDEFFEILEREKLKGD